MSGAWSFDGKHLAHNAPHIYVQLTDEQILRLILELHRKDGASTVTANDGTRVVLINVSEE